METVIAAVYTCRNEADIVELSFRHMLSQGIDRIYVADGMSTDGTREIIDDLVRDLPITLIEDRDPFHFQPKWTNQLAAQAAREGHEWIIAADVDEFWYATDGTNIAKAVAGAGSDKLFARMFAHTDWDHRAIEPKRFPKVAYRWSSSAVVANGNHEVSANGGQFDVLDLREIQYRSFEHFKQKTIERNATIDPSLPESEGWHHKRLASMTDEQMEAEWAQLMSVPTVLDPVPSSSRYTAPGAFSPAAWTHSGSTRQILSWS